MNQIVSVEQLITSLSKCTKDEFVDIAPQLLIAPEEFKPYQFWSNQHYTRNCIVRTDLYELILICWEEGQKTPVHCHGGEECWVYMVDGSMEEYRFKLNDQDDLIQTEKLAMNKSDISYMHDDLGFHSLFNVAKGKSMSLHLYMNPISECRVYDKSQERFEIKKMRDYSYAGALLESA